MKKLIFLAMGALLLAGCGGAPAVSNGGFSNGSGPALASVAAYPETINLSVGSHETIQTVLTPADASEQDLIWASSNREVAVVDESGKVSAVGAGTCTITVASKAYSDVSCHVEVIVSGNTAPANGATPMYPSSGHVVYIEETNAASVYPTYYLSDQEVAAMDQDQIQFIINQIYAKNGYVFSKDHIQDYFSRMPWYVPVSNDASRLNMSSLDRSNLNLLVQHRESSSSKSSTDLGWMWTRHAVDSALSANYVKNLSDYDIQLLINTIYAKNGYIFETDSLQYMFEGQPWYTGVTHDVDQLNFSSLDQKNLALLTSYRG